MAARLNGVLFAAMLVGCGNGGGDSAECDEDADCDTTAGETCDLDSGQCQQCVQDCGDRNCDVDPICGQSCGDCDDDWLCSAQGICECVPDCSATVCGLDPRCGQSCGDCLETLIANGDFELPVAPGARRPPYWYLGFREDPAPVGQGTWAIDTAEKYEGEQSLKLEPTGSLMVSQILHLPAALLEGRTVTVRLRIRHQGLDAPPTFIAAGFNPEITEEHPILGPGMAGAYVAQADSAEGEWQEYVGNFTATAPATAVVVVLSTASAAGVAWFDDVRVAADTWDPGPGPDPASVTTPLTERAFDMGFTQNSPMDFSELGYEGMLDENATTGEVLNLFFHVRWCEHALSSVPCGEDPVHLLGIELAAQARARGLKLALTLDFTHNSLDGIGDLNPLPDGSSVGAELAADVRAAYEAELLWLYDQLAPEYVIVGIEADIMYQKHPDWWSDFVTMEASVYDAVKARDASTHVTAYFTLDWMVDQSGALNATNAAVWRQLQPKIDSVAYSTYPNVSLAGVAVSSYPAGYFSRPSEVAPELPVLLAEFGMVGGGDSGYTEAEQANVLRQMLSEIASVDPCALIWYTAYDQLYLGQGPWFKAAFQRQGLKDWDGTAKEALVVWQKTAALD